MVVGALLLAWLTDTYPFSRVSHHAFIDAEGTAECGAGWLGGAEGNLQQACCRLWAEKAERHAASLRRRQAAQAARAGMLRPSNKTAYDMYEPSWRCHIDRRLGLVNGDGMWVCGPNRFFADRTCLVYAIGSNGDFSFETAVREHLGCEIHTFDPTGNSASIAKKASEAAGVNFHALGLAAAAEGAHLPLRDIVEQLGHQHRMIDLVKIDCEGCEHTALDGVWADLRQGLYGVGQIQIQIQVHRARPARVARLFDAAEAAGFRLFHKEPSHSGCSASACAVDFSLIGEQTAWDVFKLDSC